MSFHKSCFEQNLKAVKNEVLEKLIEIMRDSKTTLVDYYTDKEATKPMSDIITPVRDGKYLKPHMLKLMNRLSVDGFSFIIRPPNMTVAKEKIEEYTDRSKIEYRSKYRYIYSFYYHDTDSTVEFPYTDWKSKYMVYDGNVWHRK